MISAVFDAGDEDNPGGESLRSEPITLYAPDVPDGVEIQIPINRSRRCGCSPR